GHDACLVELPGPNLEPRADTERVVLAAAGAECRELHLHAELGIAAVVAQEVHTGAVPDEDVLVAVTIEVGDEHWSDGIAPYVGRQRGAAIVESACAIVVKQRSAVRAGHQQVDPAIVVVVYERPRAGGDRADALEHGQGAAITCEPAPPIVVPEAAPGDEQVQRAVVVVVANGHRTVTADRVGRAREAAHAVVVKQTVQ